MHRPRPPFVAGGYYHFYNRGAHRASIFREPTNYLFVIHKIEHYCQELSLALIAYCLMPNHYHFLIRQNGERPAGLLPQLVFNSYVKAYNKMYEHTGTLFEGHFKTRHVESYDHLVHLCRYIHANPVKDGMVTSLEDWPYSNYLDWLGEREGGLVDRNFVEEHFPCTGEYREFVMNYLRSREMKEDVEE